MTKEARTYKRKKKVSSVSAVGTAMCERIKSEHSLTYTKINSKWIKDLNLRPNTIKLPEENICRTLFDINHSSIFLNPPSKVMKIKTKVNNWD